MRNQYYYLKLAKIRIGPGSTTKNKLPLPNEKHSNLLNKYSEIWGKIKEVNRKDFNVKVIHKNITTKIKSCRNEIKTANQF